MIRYTIVGKAIVVVGRLRAGLIAELEMIEREVVGVVDQLRFYERWSLVPICELVVVSGHGVDVEQAVGFEIHCKGDS